MSRLKLNIQLGVFLLVLICSCNHLKKDEIAKIRMETSGCFGSYTEIITIIQNDTSLSARFQSEKLTKQVPISEVDLKEFRGIISKIKPLMHRLNCTNSVKFIVYTNSEVFTRTDEGCQETGFDNFKMKILHWPE